jgi:3-dehydrosphinganine reductase
MLSNRTVVITGGSSGIGAALALRLARRGSRIALIARDADKLARAAEEIRSQAADAKVEVFPADVTRPEEVEAAMARISQVLGPVEVLINSAGVLSGAYFEHQPVERFRAEMETNFFGALHCIKAALPYLKQARAGRIVNISSIAGVLGVFGYTSYCSTKHALVGLSEALRSELKPQGIAVQVVLPPEVMTPMLRGIKNARPIENRKLAGIMKPMSVDAAADEILAGIESGRLAIMPGWRSRAMIRVSQIWPGIYRWVVDYRVRKYYRGPGG